MSANVELKPGRTPLIHWRAIYRGAPVSLDPYARPDVEAGLAALAEITAHGEMPPPQNASPSVADLMEKGGDRLPFALVRLFVALKLASLAQGTSGVRWETLRGIDAFLAAGLLPVVPADGVNDHMALSYLFAALTGTGEIVRGEKRQPAAKALKKTELSPIELNPQERSALLSGAELTTAAALAGLFEAERVFHSALVAAALSATAIGHPRSSLHPIVHRLYRQPGQIEVAKTLNALRGLGKESLAADESDAEETGGLSAPLKMGACLDLLRHAGATLEGAANAVTQDRLILWQTGEIVAGVEDRSSAARAADIVALALTTIGDLSKARIAALARAANAEDRDAEQPSPDTNAASFVQRIREQAAATADARRLLPMVGMTALVLAVEFLEATRACEGDAERTGSKLDDALRLIREVAPHAASTNLPAAGNLAAIADRVSSGALAAAVGIELPDVGRRGYSPG